jgi:hypothetical protein
VGIPSPLVPFFVAPEVGLPGSTLGSSNSCITNHVLSVGKALRFSFKGDDVLEESRLVALEVRDYVAKAAVGVDRSVP